MKTLTINGLVFTDQPPTKEGCWLWTDPEQDNFIEVGSVHKHHRYKEKLVFTSHLSDGCPEDMTGFWHELIPRQKFAEEVEKAWEEGYLDGAVRKDNAWPKSRAKLVAEGKEPSV
jgi:hypothetical protein